MEVICDLIRADGSQKAQSKKRCYFLTEKRKLQSKLERAERTNGNDGDQ